MIGKTLMVAGLIVAFATPVMAGHCPADVKAIDHALANLTIGGDKAAEIKKLRNEGEALHLAGKHGDSVNVLAKAMRLILNAQ